MKPTIETYTTTVPPTIMERLLIALRAPQGAVLDLSEEESEIEMARRRA
jgi:hypothetical protein